MHVSKRAWNAEREVRGGRDGVFQHHVSFEPLISAVREKAPATQKVHLRFALTASRLPCIPSMARCAQLRSLDTGRMLASRHP